MIIVTEIQMMELRDMLIEVRADVKALIRSRDDHESRLRATERAITEMESVTREQAAATRRVLGWGMLLAAMAGGIGNFILRAAVGR